MHRTFGGRRALDKRSASRSPYRKVAHHHSPLAAPLLPRRNRHCPLRAICSQGKSAYASVAIPNVPMRLIGLTPDDSLARSDWRVWPDEGKRRLRRRARVSSSSARPRARVSSTRRGRRPPMRRTSRPTLFFTPSILAALSMLITAMNLSFIASLGSRGRAGRSPPRWIDVSGRRRIPTKTPRGSTYPHLRDAHAPARAQRRCDRAQ
jgi:hypothetical protein